MDRAVMVRDVLYSYCTDFTCALNFRKKRSFFLRSFSSFE